MLPKRLKQCRKELELTQQQVADKLGLTRQAYTWYEQGKRTPNNEMLCKIADFFHVSTDYLLGRTQTKNWQVLNE